MVEFGGDNRHGVGGGDVEGGEDEGEDDDEGCKMRERRGWGGEEEGCRERQ